MARGTWGGVADRHPFQVKVSWLTGTNVSQLGFHVRATGAEIGDANSIAQEVETWAGASLKTILFSAQRIVGIDVVDLVSREGASRSPSNMVGTLPGNEFNRIPSYMAAVVSMKGELRTRYGQGRFFLPVGDESFVMGDTLATAGSAALQGVVTDLTNRLVGGSFAGYRLINVHGLIPEKAATATRPLRPAVQPGWYDVTSLRLNSTLTFLRSRKAGVGS